MMEISGEMSQRGQSVIGECLVLAHPMHADARRLGLRQAFTLIELLVVVAILGILMAMIFPAIALVRGSAQSVQCMNHMRQIGLGTLGYMTDNEGMSPVSQASVNGVSWNDYEYLYDNMGFDQLLDNGYLNRDRASASVLFCPSRPFLRGNSKYTNTGAGSGNIGLDLRDMIATNDYQGRWQYPGYIMRNKIPNENLNPARAFSDYSFQFSTMSASRTAYISDRTTIGIYTGLGGGTNAPYEWKSYHRKSYNVWYFDGSVRAVSNTALTILWAGGGDTGTTFIAFDSR